MKNRYYCVYIFGQRSVNVIDFDAVNMQEATDHAKHHLGIRNASCDKTIIRIGKLPKVCVYDT